MLYFSKVKLVIIYFIIVFLSLFAFANLIENENNFSYLKKIYDSSEKKYVYNVKFFEINYKEFDRNYP